jgi:Flp pilus assembly protein TadG
VTRDQRGQTTILVVGIVVLVMSVIGLAVDGTRAFLYRRALQSAADAAALAGAGEIARDSYYASRGRTIEIEPHSARNAAERWLDLRSLSVETAVASSPTEVTVALRGEIPTLFLRLIGITSVPVGAEAASSPLVLP